jgi:Tol biopolymer transport system component
MQVISSPGNPISSPDSRHLYISAREKDGTSSIWQLPANGDPETRLVHFTDPDHQFFRPSFSSDSKSFYLVLGDRQSDIWTMELKKK